MGYVEVKDPPIVLRVLLCVVSDGGNLDPGYLVQPGPGRRSRVRTLHLLTCVLAPLSSQHFCWASVGSDNLIL